ncbi:hypothetical protein NEUTE2DRAFT_55758, partial [Neurospora tetrasperma FGSC 2509]
YKSNINARRSDAPKYKEGNKVLFNIKNLNISRPYTKFIPIFEGPFEIFKADSY